MDEGERRAIAAEFTLRPRDAQLSTDHDPECRYRRNSAQLGRMGAVSVARRCGEARFCPARCELNCVRMITICGRFWVRSGWRGMTVMDAKRTLPTPQDAVATVDMLRNHRS